MPSHSPVAGTNPTTKKRRTDMPQYRIIVREVSEYAYEGEAASLEEAKQNYADWPETWSDGAQGEIVNWEELGD